MSTVNKAKVWAFVPTTRAKQLPRTFSVRRLRNCVYQPDGKGLTKVGFDVPVDYTVMQALVLLSQLTPEGTEVYCS